MRSRDLDLDEGLDPEGPSPDDLERFGDELIDCPECGRAVYDQAELCPDCGHALSREPRGLPNWAIIVVGVILAGFLLVFVI